MEKKRPNVITYPWTCTSCNKEMVAGPYPQWFCLHKECVEYLKPKNL